MTILVTGGAGYIGSFMVRRLLEEGHTVVVLDSLEKGYRRVLPDTVIFEEGSLLNKDLLTKVFEKYAFDAVFHFAAYISVAESVENPLKYFSNNVSGTVNLLTAMKDHDCHKFIFSSTAAVYGTPERTPIPEDHKKHPESPYGLSKLMIEDLLPDVRKAHGIDYVVLRYFNASGAAIDGSIGEGHTPETHMIPCAIKAVLDKQPFTLYGTDYDTPDGTCVRDYIHVMDLAEAHILAMNKIFAEPDGYIYNVGTGKGYSNKEVVDAVKRISGQDLEVVSADRRPGDPSTLIADSTKIKKELGFEPKYSELDTIVSSAWNWHSSRERDN